MIEAIENERYFNFEYEIDLVFEDEINTFDRFRHLFESLMLIDSTYNFYKSHYNKQEVRLSRKRTFVKRVSKESPLEIVAFIEEHWLTLFLVYLVSYKDVKANILESSRDIDFIIENVENVLRDIMDDFPNFEISLIRNQLHDILIWLSSLPPNEKHSIFNRMRRAGGIFRRLKKITIKKKNHKNRE